MENNYSKTSEQPIGRWWLSIIVGLVAIAAGVIVFINPVASYLAIALWLGVAVFLSGIFNLVQCFPRKVQIVSSEMSVCSSSSVDRSAKI